MVIYAMLVCAGFYPLSCMVLAAEHRPCCVNKTEAFPLCIVYDLRTQTLKFVAPMPEQNGTPAVHFLMGKVTLMVEGCVTCGMGTINLFFRLHHI